MTAGSPLESPALKRAYMAGRHAHADLELPFEAFADAAARATHRRLEKLGVADDPAAREAAWERLRGADLYLAQACEAQVPSAWFHVHESYAPRLTAIARRQGVRGADAEGLATEVLAELALPPSSGETRTRMGSFGGACTLAGWMAVVLTRRIAAKARRKQPVSLDAGSDAEEGRPEQAERTPSDPLTGVLDEEARGQLRDAFARAWEGLTPKERLALVAKYRDGRKQKEIAALLSVGEPRVSRLVQQALAKVGDAFREAVDGQSGSWDGLRDAVQQALASSVVDPPLPSGGGDRGGSRETG